MINPSQVIRRTVLLFMSMTLVACDQSAPATQEQNVASTSNAPTGQQSVEQVAQKAATAAEQTSQTQPEKSSLGKPPVEFDPPVLDLGTISPGTNTSGTIEIVNTSDETLRIAASRASCNCTSVNLRNETIPPRGRLPFDVQFKTNVMGQRGASVRILFAGYEMTSVPIRAMVAFAVRADPSYVNALPDREGRPQLTGQYIVKSDDGKPFRILSVNGGPVPFIDHDPASDDLRSIYRLKWDLSSYNQSTCVDANGNHMPGWFVIETDHPGAPIFDLEIRNECNRRESIQRTDQWVISEKRVLVGVVEPGKPELVEVLAKWFPKRSKADTIDTVASESEQFTAELVETEPHEEGTLCTVKITPSQEHEGFLYGSMRFYSRLQNASMKVIGTVRKPDKIPAS